MQDTHKRHIAILGSTGSIGTQALEVIAQHAAHFEVEVLTAHRNAKLLIEQAMQHKPNAVVIADVSLLQEVKNALEPHYIKVYGGQQAIDEVVQMETIDMVLAAMVGFAGLSSVLSAINAGKTIALANKETLVVAGELVTALAKKKAVNLLPVDSEHSAIFQCLMGEFHNPIKKIILTASGGPFRGKTLEELAKVGVKDALKHPNWDMGAKITIDSASMMNKGLEVIEAKWLFALKPEQIEVVVHPQSIIHSLVEFEDGSLKAQLGEPDMRLPIQFALGYPQRFASEWKTFSFMNYPQLTFQAPDYATFRCLALAKEAMHTGQGAPCILNAANEVAVDAFLHEHISFLEIAALVEHCLSKQEDTKPASLEAYLELDNATRSTAKQWLAKRISTHLV